MVLQVPVLLGGFEKGLRQRQTRVVDHEVDAAEREQCRVDRGLNPRGVGDVRGHADRAVLHDQFAHIRKAPLDVVDPRRRPEVLGFIPPREQDVGRRARASSARAALPIRHSTGR